MRYGADVQLPNEKGQVVHIAEVVYGEMLRQICLDYPGIPEPSTLSLSEIVWWYRGLRPALRKHTKK